MRALEATLASMGKTRASFFAHCHAMPVSVRAWLFEMAEENEGAWTHDEVLASAKIVFAVWEDADKPGGVGVVLVKGLHALGEKLASADKMRHMTAVKCGGEAEAHALIQ